MPNVISLAPALNEQSNLLPTIFQFDVTQQAVRSFIINDEPFIVAKDVCAILGHSNHKVAIKALDEDEVRKVYLTDKLGRRQQNILINESGLYALIFRSNKPEAKAFRKWVTSQVLPQLRRSHARMESLHSTPGWRN